MSLITPERKRVLEVLRPGNVWREEALFVCESEMDAAVLPMREGSSEAAYNYYFYLGCAADWFKQHYGDRMNAALFAGRVQRDMRMLEKHAARRLMSPKDLHDVYTFVASCREVVSPLLSAPP